VVLNRVASEAKNKTNPISGNEMSLSNERNGYKDVFLKNEPKDYAFLTEFRNRHFTGYRVKRGTTRQPPGKNKTNPISGNEMSL
jgi:hypothetical protein